jgi:hypothetical protein
MARQVLIELVLFLVPFAAYGVFLVLTRKGVLDWESWPLSRLAWLAMAALVLMIGGFFGLANLGVVPPGSIYIPAHIDEHGNFVPGQTVPGPK